jgi:hypothetical protein
MLNKKTKKDSMVIENATSTLLVNIGSHWYTLSKTI